MRVADFALLADRLLLAAVFLLSGTAKLADPAGLRHALRDFGLPPAIAPTAMLLPLLELAVSAMLIPVALAWYGACGALALLSAFTAIVTLTMMRGRRPECHCFGQLHSAPISWQTLGRNFALAACAGWIVERGRLHSGLGLWPWFIALDGQERKLALLAGGIGLYGFFHLLARARPIDSAESDLETEPLFPNDAAADDNDDNDDNGNETERMRPRRPAAIAVRRPYVPPPEEPPSGPMGIGLPIGTPAPDFELPALAGERRSLQSLWAAGNDVVLIFSSPFCDSCAALAANLVRWIRETKGLPNIVIISSGAVQDNAAKLKGFDPSQVLLQHEFEVSQAFDNISTPAAVLIGADGRIRSLLATGGLAIRQLLASCAQEGNAKGNHILDS